MRPEARGTAGAPITSLTAFPTSLRSFLYGREARYTPFLLISSGPLHPAEPGPEGVVKGPREEKG